MEDFYKENLEAVNKRFPQVYDKILNNDDSCDESYDTNFEESVNGEKICFVNYNNRINYLNSRYDAYGAASIWANGFNDVNFKSIIILYGMANMMYVKALLERLGKDNIVMLYEPSQKLFRTALQEIDMREVLDDDRLFYFINGINTDAFRAYCKALFEYERIGFSKIAISPNYNQPYKSEIAEFLCMCEAEIFLFQIYKNTYIEYGAEMNDNLIDNIYGSIYTSSIDNLKVEIKKMNIIDVPAFIVAAGPSLDKNINELKNAIGKSLIIAVDSSIRALLQRNIIPDLLVTTDPHKPMVLFEDERALEIPLIVCMHSRYEIMAKHRGQKFMFSDSDYIIDIYNRFGKEISSLQTGGSVANTAFSLVKFLGFKTIVLMGQDLAFTNNKKHANNVYEEKEVGEDPSDKYTEVEGINGEPLLTFANFKVYRDWFEAEIRDNPDLKVINATEGGAKIHGAPNQTLKDTIEQNCILKIDFKNTISKVKDAFDDSQKIEYIEIFRRMVDKAKELDEKFKQGIRDYKRFKELIRNRKCNTIEFKKLMKKIEEINNISNVEVYMELVSMYAKEDEYKITENIYQVDGNSSIESEGNAIADKGIAMLEAYIKANVRALDRIQKSLERQTT